MVLYHNYDNDRKIKWAYLTLTGPFSKQDETDHPSAMYSDCTEFYRSPKKQIYVVMVQNYQLRPLYFVHIKFEKLFSTCFILYCSLNAWEINLVQ